MTYIDHHEEPRYVRGRAPDFRVTHSWADFTENRLRELYGPNHRAERAAMTAADLACWRALGSNGRAAA